MSEEISFEESAPWFVVFITLVGGWLRMLLLGTKGMWLDETFSVWVANHSVIDMLQWIIKIDQHPPLYYFLLHYWIAAIGDTPYDARLLSVLFGVGTIPVIYLIGKRMAGALVGLAAAVILAFSPFHIFYAQETRMYTLLTFNAAVAIYALVRLLTDSRAAQPIGSQFREYLHTWRTAGPGEPNSKDDFSYKVELPRTGWRAWVSRHRWPSIETIETDLAWVAFVIFSAATLLSHNTAVFLPLATNFFVSGLILFKRMNKSDSPPAFQAPSVGNWVKAQVAIFLLWSPWIFAFIKQANRVYQRFWIPEPTWDAVYHVFKSFLNPSLTYLQGNQVMVMGSLYALVLCLGLGHYRKKLSHFLLLATLFAIPFLGELIVSIWRPIFYDRTLIWTTLSLFLVLAAGVAQLKFSPLILLALGSLVTLNLFSVSDYYLFYQKEDWSTAAGYVALYAEKDDLVLFNSNFVEIPFDYYFRTHEHLYDIQVEKQGVPLDLFGSGILEPTMTEGDIPKLISLLHGHKRVWLVYSHNSYTDPMGLIPETLASQGTLIRERDFYGGQVQLYAIP